MLDSTWLKLCQEKNDIEPNLLFEETTPPRMRSKIPGMNMFYASKYGDNIYVQLLEMPDKKTFVTTTDQAVPLIFNTETLKQEGLLHWDDKLACIMGITHAKTLKDGTMISYCSNEGLSTTINVYKINPATPLTRESIGIFKTEKLAYGHSFGLTEDYAIILEQPIEFQMMGMMEGNPMIKDMLLQKGKTTKIHVMKLSDGTVQTFDTGLWSITLHVGNSYIDTDGSLVLEGQTYENPDVNPFALVEFEKLENES